MTSIPAPKGDPDGVLQPQVTNLITAIISDASRLRACSVARCGEARMLAL